MGALSGDLPNMRQQYRAGHGKVLIHADYSQLELRVMAAVAPDRELQRRLDEGDVYSADARDWFRLPADMDVKKVKPAARKQSKIIHLAAQYAAGTPAVYVQALEQDQTMKYEAVELLHKRGFLITYTDTVNYWHEEQERVRRDGYSESRILNRRRVYPREPPITEIANYPIQSTASDIANLAMIELDAKLRKYVPGANIIVQLHDAFDVEAPASKKHEVGRLMRDVMEQQREINGKKYAFPVEIKCAVFWSDL